MLVAFSGVILVMMFDEKQTLRKLSAHIYKIINKF